MAKSLSFTIRGRLPGLNEYVKANRGNKYHGASLKKETEEYIRYQVPRGVDFSGKVRVHFDWYEPNSRRDPDNTRLGAKFILDALVTLGIIESDSRRYIAGLSDSFYTDTKRPRVEVTITEVDE